MTVAMVFIDTILLAGKTDPKDMYSSPCGPDSQKAADDQWAWINQTLANYSKPGSRVGWKFVVGHCPGMSLIIVHSNAVVTVCSLINHGQIYSFFSYHVILWVASNFIHTWDLNFE